LKEIRDKQAVRSIVAVGAANPSSDYSLHCAAFDDLADAYRTPVGIIFSQMLGLFSSIELGLMPDSPSPNGIISRVVETFAIYD